MQQTEGPTDRERKLPSQKKKESWEDNLQKMHALCQEAGKTRWPKKHAQTGDWLELGKRAARKQLQLADDPNPDEKDETR